MGFMARFGVADLGLYRAGFQFKFIRASLSRGESNLQPFWACMNPYHD